jgi:hypothetical protein
MPKREIRNRPELVRQARRPALAAALAETRSRQRRTLLAQLWLARTGLPPAAGTR